jgi:uncharacterized protein YjdB
MLTLNKYVVTASNSHGSTQTGVYIAVLPILVDDIKISSTSDTLVIGESAQLHVTISPNDASSFTSLRCA